MIFSQLFQPKYKHKDPLVRIQAIEQLSAGNNKEKAILHELAFNDADARVSLAALNRLNNFDLWWKMADIAKDERIGRHAKNKVEATLLGDSDVPLDGKTRRSFIRECRVTALLETLLQKNAIDNGDTDLMLSALQKINKPQLNMRYLLETQNHELRDALFAAVRDEAELQKIVKKTTDDTLREKAQIRLNAIASEREKPIQLSKDTTLVLSKLLALNDVSDFATLTGQRKELVEQFQQLQKQFLLLEDSERESFNSKFDTIQHKLDSKVASLQSDWDAQQELERTSLALQEAKKTCNYVLDNVGDALSNDVEGITLGQLESFNNDIQAAEVKLSSMLQAKLNPAEYRAIEDLVNRLMASRTSLESLPALQTAITQAKDLLEQFKQLPLPDDLSQVEAAGEYLDDIKLRWRELVAPFEAIWPTHLQKQWQTQIKDWHRSLKQLRDAMHNNVTTVRRRLNGIVKAIDNGRFRNAIRNYEHVKNDYLGLPEEYQARLGRQFEDVKQQIENLIDWQAYIAKPRKPEILKDIEQLVLHPLEPKQQADRVKELRKEWNSLGKLESEADEAMNHAFDLACEEAFKPCREYYAELEQERENNLKSKEALLQQLSKAAKGDVAQLAKHFKDMQQSWRTIGGVDYKQLDALNERYKAVVEPIKAKVEAFYQQNAEAKQALLEKAESLLELDDWREATEEAKKLQDKWRKVEFAGQKLENRLWSEFRKVNDQIFARREQAMSEQQEVVQTEIDNHLLAVQQIKDKVDDSRSRGELQQLLTDVVKPAQEKLLKLPKKDTKEALLEVGELRRVIEEKCLYLDDSERHAQYEAIFSTLTQWREGNLPESVHDLPTFWRQAFLNSNIDDGQWAKFNRLQLLLVMESEKGIETPKSDEAIKKDTQMQLMAMKLQDGIHVDCDDLLLEWVQRGPLSEQEKPLMARLRQCFVAD